MSHPLKSLHGAGLSGASQGFRKARSRSCSSTKTALLQTVGLAMDSALKAGRIFLSLGKQEGTLFKSWSGHNVMSLLVLVGKEGSLRKVVSFYFEKDFCTIWILYFYEWGNTIRILKPREKQTSLFSVIDMGGLLAKKKRMKLIST